jgi:hypothetical protein
MIHELKTDPIPFEQVREGLKTFEIRRDDRNFRGGDQLILRKTEYTGAQMAAGAPLVYCGCPAVVVQVLSVMRGPIYGLAEGWCIMSIDPYPLGGVR